METMTNDEIMTALSNNEKNFVDFIQYYGKKCGEAKIIKDLAIRYLAEHIEEDDLFYIDCGKVVFIKELKNELIKEVEEYTTKKDSLLAKLKRNGAILVSDSPFKYMEVKNHLPDPLEGEDFKV